MFGVTVTTAIGIYVIIALIIMYIVDKKRGKKMSLYDAQHEILHAINNYDLTEEQKFKLVDAVKEIQSILDDLEREGKYFDN